MIFHLPILKWFTKEKFVLSVLVLLSFFLRVYKIESNPPALNWDEVSHGYNAYSILKTGQDEWGKTFPLIFRAYGDFKLPLYIYLTVPFVWLLGLIGLSVRMVSILSGVGIVYLAYLLSYKFTNNKPISWFAALLTSISPWSLFVSRVAVEANLGAFLFSLGMYFFLIWLNEGKGKWLALTAAGWGFSLYAYNSCRLLVPIFLAIVLFMVIKRKEFKQLLLPGFIVAIFIVPLFLQVLDQSGRARYQWVTLLDQGAVNQINDKRNNSNLPKNISILLYNKPSYFIYQATVNYFKNLSPRYLFFYGGSNYQFSLPDHELLFLVTALFLILGLVKAAKTKENNYKLLFCWFFISLIPSAITKDAPHILRTILILPAPMIITAIGVKYTIDLLKDKSRFGGKLFVWVLTLAILFSFGRWWKDYWTVYPASYSWAWQYGYKEAVSYVKAHYNDYDRIIISKRYGEPHEFFLFYLKYDPLKYQNDKNKKWDYHANWYWVDGFDKFEFVNDWEMKEKSNIKNQISKTGSNEKLLLITSPGNYSEGWDKIKTIDFLDGKPAFEILENN